MSNTVIVTGSREWALPATVMRVLENTCPRLVVQGGCPTGADEAARAWCSMAGVKCVTYYANWKKHGKKAGPLRNGLMIRSHLDALVLAFPLDGPGTWDCIEQARKAGMTVHVYDVDGNHVPGMRR